MNSQDPLPPNVIALKEMLRTRFPQAHAQAQTQPGQPVGRPAPVTAAAATARTNGIGLTYSASGRLQAVHLSGENPAPGVCLDELLGLGRGTLTEVVGSRAGCGIGLIIASLLEQHSGRSPTFSGLTPEPTALVDGSDAFDPWSVPPDILDKLLWVRCRETLAAVKAADLLLRDGNIHLVLLDLQMQPLPAVRSLPSSVWHRLRLLAEKSGAALCAFTPGRVVSAARSRVMVEHRFDLDDLYQARAVLTAELPARVDRGGNLQLRSA